MGRINQEKIKKYWKNDGITTNVEILLTKQSFMAMKTFFNVKLVGHQIATL